MVLQRNEMHCDRITRTLPQCIMHLYSVEAKAVVKVVKGAGCLTELRLLTVFFFSFFENIPSHQLKWFTHPCNVYQSGKRLVDKVKLQKKRKKNTFLYMTGQAVRHDQWGPIRWREDVRNLPFPQGENINAHFCPIFRRKCCQLVWTVQIVQHPC